MWYKFHQIQTKGIKIKAKYMFNCNSYKGAKLITKLTAQPLFFYQEAFIFLSHLTCMRDEVWYKYYQNQIQI